jgi:hypothetical protein
MPGTLYLIPNTLGPIEAAPRALSNILPEQVQDIASKLEYYVAENAKTARAFLKLVGVDHPLARPLQEIKISELNVNTPPQALAALLAPLLQMATTRGRLLELMSLALRPGDAACAATAFTVGMMSLMDALLSIPMAKILDRVDVSQDVRAALLDRAGDFGAMLIVAEELEGKECGRRLRRALDKLGLSGKQIRGIELAAFDWVRELGAEARTH